MTAVAVPEQDEAVDFHGDIHFCHYDTKTREFWEYVARFTEGRCVRIGCVENGIR